MEITVKKTVEEKVQITLPAFYKTSCHQIKIYSDEKCIYITKSDYGINSSITTAHSGLAFTLNAEPSTESEFLDMYNQVNSELCQLATV